MQQQERCGPEVSPIRRPFVTVPPSFISRRCMCSATVPSLWRTPMKLAAAAQVIEKRSVAPSLDTA